MFYSILFCSILFCSVLFCSVIFYSILFYSILFCYILFCSILFCSILFCSVLFYSILGCVRPLQDEAPHLPLSFAILVHAAPCCPTIIIIVFKGAIRDFLQSPHSAANRLRHVRSSGLGAIVCKSRATHRQFITCKCHVTCHLVRRDSSAIKFDRVEIAFI